MSRLTGRIRFRPKRRWFRPPLLVLQVERVDLIGNYVAAGHQPKKEVRTWRDATMEDLTLTKKFYDDDG